MAEKVLVVTGGSRGIGACVARQAAAKGFAVAVNYNAAKDRAEALVREIDQAGGKAVAIRADMRIEADIVRLFAETDKRLGRTTHLVNNAGVPGAMLNVEEMTTQSLNDLFALNVYSYFLCAREAVKRMHPKHGGKGGVIVNISSAAARTGGLPKHVAYAASKGAIDSFSAGLGKELGADKIRVVGLRPGVTRTEILDPMGGDQYIATLEPTIPMKRAGRPEEIAAAAVWLLTDEASYISAVTIDVTGGR
jgi:NAD(P)-dependent dehydrogenase (short-subunit alcohol dehydrogenase family)